MDIIRKQNDFSETIDRLGAVKTHEEFDQLVKEIKRIDLYIISIYKRFNDKKRIRERFIEKLYDGDDEIFSMVPDVIIDNNIMSDTEITAGIKSVLDFYFEEYLLQSFNPIELDRHLMSIDNAYDINYKFDDINDFQPVFLKVAHHGLMASMIYSCVKYLHFYFRKTKIIMLGKNEGLSVQMNECKRAYINNCENSSFNYISVSKPGWYLKLKKMVCPNTIVCIASDIPDLYFNELKKMDDAKELMNIRTSSHTFDVESYSFFERSVENFNASALTIKHDGDYSITVDNSKHNIVMPFNKWVYWPAIDLYDIKNIKQK